MGKKAKQEAIRTTQILARQDQERLNVAIRESEEQNDLDTAIKVSLETAKSEAHNPSGDVQSNTSIFDSIKGLMNNVNFLPSLWTKTVETTKTMENTLNFIPKIMDLFQNIADFFMGMFNLTKSELPASASTAVASENLNGGQEDQTISSSNRLSQQAPFVHSVGSDFTPN